MNQLHRPNHAIRTKRVPLLLQVCVALALLLTSILWYLPLQAAPTTRAQDLPQTFPQTGKTVREPFLGFWTANGGIAQYGYPISDELQERSETNNKFYIVQYFERAVFEYHPENQPPDNVQLSLLGNFIYKEKYPNGAPNQQPSTDPASQLFAQTGHRIGGRFLEYWKSHGDVTQQGYPISDEFQEKSEIDGELYTVQYFERAVFELHTANKPPFDVLLSQLGTFRYRARVSNDIHLEVDPNDIPIEIRRNEQGRLVGSLRLLSPHTALEGFTFYPNHLRSIAPIGNSVVDRHKVLLIGNRKLDAGTYKEFQIEVLEVGTPGMYTGTVVIQLPSQALTSALSIPVQVDANALPAIVPLPGTDHVQMRLVNCLELEGWFPWYRDCDIARLVLPSSSMVNARALEFSNPAVVRSRITYAGVTLSGQSTGYQLSNQVPNGALHLPATGYTLRSNGPVTIPLTIDRKDIPPDHYSGNIYLAINGRPEQIRIPIDIEVRTGPFGPIVALLFGLVLGRLLKYWRDRGERLTVAQSELYQLQSSIGSAYISDDDRHMLATMVEEVREAISWGRYDSAKQDVANVRKRLGILVRLHSMKVSLEGRKDSPSATTEQKAEIDNFLREIAENRKYIAQRQEAVVAQELDSLQSETERLLSRTQTGGLAGQQSQPGFDRVATQTGGQSLKPTWRGRLAAWLSGSNVGELMDTQRAERKSLSYRLYELSRGFVSFITPFLRWVLGLALILGLLLVGLNTLYVETGPTFGTNPLTEYLGLILWGISTDVVTRSFSNLTGGSSSGKSDSSGNTPTA